MNDNSLMENSHLDIRKRNLAFLMHGAYKRKAVLVSQIRI